MVKLTTSVEAKGNNYKKRRNKETKITVRTTVRLRRKHKPDVVRVVEVTITVRYNKNHTRLNPGRLYGNVGLLVLTTVQRISLRVAS